MSAVDILKNHKLRITNSRVDVLGSFLEENRALSLGNLETEFPNYDRVTLYRTLNSFLESGILHKIPNDLGTATYGLCHETCGPAEHNHDHVHFKCNDCGKLECLDDLNVPNVSVPTGYRISQVNMIVDGTCVECAG